MAFNREPWTVNREEIQRNNIIFYGVKFMEQKKCLSEIFEFLRDRGIIFLRIVSQILLRLK